MRVFLVWKRRYADVRAGTQAPPLRILLEKVARGTVGFVWVDYARGRLVAFETEIWPSAIFSVLAPHPRVNTILLLHATG